MKSQLKNTIENLRTQLWLRRNTRNSRHNWMVQHFGLPELSKAELQAVQDTWPWLKVSNQHLVDVRMYKHLHGFDPYFLSDYQFRHILKFTNDYDQLSSLQNKAMVDVYFPDIPFPRYYVKQLRGVVWMDGQCYPGKTAAQLLLEKGITDFVIKPAMGGYCGKGVQVVHLSETTPDSQLSALNSIIAPYGLDFIVQEVLEQHPAMAQFNPECANCLRVSTMLVRGNFHYSMMQKVGRQGSHIDNWNSSILVGVNSDDGTLLETGYDYNLNSVQQSDNGIAFKGIRVPQYEKIIASVKEWHTKYFPNIGFIGWDVMVDKASRIRVIEANLDFPGIRMEQICSGTFFRQCHDDINNIIYEKAPLPTYRL